jgi:nucleotide-binding universal stress UspA family protein
MNVLIVALDATVAPEVSDADVLVVAPALNSKLRHWLSDDDAARRKAKRLAEALAELLKRNGVRAEGRAGDFDPLLAIADALPTFPADEIVIAGRPSRRNGLDQLMARIRDRFALPIRAAGSLTNPAAE